MAFSRRLPDCHAPSIHDIKRGPRVPCPNKNRPGKILSAQTVGYQHHTGHVVISTYPSAPHDLFTCISNAIIAVDRNICQAININSFICCVQLYNCCETPPIKTTAASMSPGIAPSSAHQTPILYNHLLQLLLH